MTTRTSPALAATAAFGTIALFWTVTGRGFPFGPADPSNNASLLRALPAAVGAPLFAAVLLAAAVGVLALAGRPRPPAAVRYAALIGGWLLVAALLVVVPDVRLLALAGYAPMLLVAAPLGLLPPIDWAQVLTATLGVQLLSVATGLLFARTLLSWQFRTAGLCQACGRGPAPGRWTSPGAAARWGRWATGTAVVVPLLYAATRYSWLFGLRFGISAEGLDMVQRTGGLVAGAGLATAAVGGAVLTVGLVRRWGEVFPSWLPRIGGRPVPVRLATVPATVVAVLVMSAGLSLLSVDQLGDGTLGGPEVAWPGYLWPLWSVALAAAALAYHLRRRPPCTVCHRP
jgi:hypothetical protein